MTKYNILHNMQHNALCVILQLNYKLNCVNITVVFNYIIIDIVCNKNKILRVLAFNSHLKVESYQIMFVCVKSNNCKCWNCFDSLKNFKKLDHQHHTVFNFYEFDAIN